MIKQGRGAKVNKNKNYRAAEEWQAKKKLGRQYQVHVSVVDKPEDSHWEKIKEVK